MGANDGGKGSPPIVCKEGERHLIITIMFMLRWQSHQILRYSIYLTAIWYALLQIERGQGEGIRGWGRGSRCARAQSSIIGANVETSRVF